MYTQEDYLYGWLFYGLGALVLILCGWIITARISWGPVRNMIRLLAIVTLLVPWYANPDMAFLAPAWIIAVFEGIFEDSFWRAGGPLLSALAVAFVIGLVGLVLARFMRKDTDSTSTSDQA